MSKQDIENYHTYSIVVCPICQKTFIAYPKHIYKKYDHKGNKIRFCSWACLREYENQREIEKKNKREKRKEEAERNNNND